MILASSFSRWNKKNEVPFDAGRRSRTMEVALPGARYPDERRVIFYEEAVASLRALPGVFDAAAATISSPFRLVSGALKQ